MPNRTPSPLCLRKILKTKRRKKEINWLTHMFSCVIFATAVTGLILLCSQKMNAVERNIGNLFMPGQWDSLDGFLPKRTEPILRVVNLLSARVLVHSADKKPYMFYVGLTRIKNQVSGLALGNGCTRKNDFSTRVGLIGTSRKSFSILTSVLDGIWWRKSRTSSWHHLKDVMWNGSTDT